MSDESEHDGPTLDKVIFLANEGPEHITRTFMLMGLVRRLYSLLLAKELITREEVQSILSEMLDRHEANAGEIINDAMSQSDKEIGERMLAEGRERLKEFEETL